MIENVEKIEQDKRDGSDEKKQLVVLHLSAEIFRLRVNSRKLLPGAAEFHYLIS